MDAGRAAPHCEACLGRWPAADHRISELDLTVAYLHADQFFPGWVVLVLRRHAAELFELDREERARLIEDVNTVARALAAAFRPVKINYALLGNQLPHIHWHLVPRLSTDPDLRSPIWQVDHQPVSIAPAAANERIESIRRALGVSA